MIKECIGKKKYSHENFPKKLVINNKDITNVDLIAENFNKYFSDIGPKLAKNIEVSSIDFRSYIKEHESVQSECDLTVNELKEAFFSLKINKSSGYDGISFNVVKNCFGPLIKPLMYIFNLSLAKGIFPDDLKIARVTPVFKAGNENEVGNYRPISILPCFSKILERIMYNRLFKYLTTNEILYKKLFGFQEGHSTEHAIMQLIDNINNSFEKNHFTLGVFIDLSKAFDTVDHYILITILKQYGIQGNNIRWFESCLSSRKKHIAYNNKSTSFKGITCGVPQGSILGALLFLIYMNDLPNVSNMLDPSCLLMTLFFSNNNIKTLFATINHELEKISLGFVANRLLLNVINTFYFIKNQ